MSWEMVFIFFIMLIGSFIQGTTGFGLGLFAMGILPLFLTLKDSSLLVISLTMVLSLSLLVRLYKHIEIKSLWLILTAALTGRVLSFYFLTSFGEMDSLKKVLGFFLITIVGYTIYSRNHETPSFLLHPIAPVILGLIGGFMGGAFAVGGPFFVVYYLMLYQDKRNYNANLQLTFFMTSLFTITLHTINGDFTSAHSVYFMIGFISVLIGAQVGIRLFEKLPRNRIQSAAMLVVLLAAINLIIFS